MYLHQLSEVDEEKCLRSSIPLAHPLCMDYESLELGEHMYKCIECNIQHTQKERSFYEVFAITVQA